MRNAKDDHVELQSSIDRGYHAKVAERKITIANAAKLLNKSRRTIERYLQLYPSGSKY
ncbi:hypothetical protein [Budvicia aquatica]|uniref:hypothetical protein n=1 Tax=Budvicia aquatica TaxID=82979 RepID=UPI0004095BB2|nr:hypothetical protein [Budvicia aquatica]